MCLRNGEGAGAAGARRGQEREGRGADVRRRMAHQENLWHRGNTRDLLASRIGHCPHQDGEASRGGRPSQGAMRVWRDSLSVCLFLPSVTLRAPALLGFDGRSALPALPRHRCSAGGSQSRRRGRVSWPRGTRLPVWEALGAQRPIVPSCRKALPQERGPGWRGRPFGVQGEHPDPCAVSGFLRRSGWAPPGRENHAMAGNSRGRPTSSLKR